jgi:hypothetical protein
MSPAAEMQKARQLSPRRAFGHSLAVFVFPGDAAYQGARKLSFKSAQDAKLSQRPRAVKPPASNSQ